LLPLYKRKEDGKFLRSHCNKITDHIHPRTGVERTPAMAYWRRTTVAVSNQFLIDIDMTTEAIQAINVARGHFAMAAEVYAWMLLSR
jgi:hypothetical protein